MAREEIAQRVATLPVGANYFERRAALRDLPRDWKESHPCKVWRAEVHAYLRATLPPTQRCSGAKWCGNIGDETITVTGGLVDVQARICRRHRERFDRHYTGITPRELARVQGKST